VPSSTSRVDTAAEMQSALTAKLAKLQGMEDLRFGIHRTQDRNYNFLFVHIP
jgi:hypothetical protein